MSLIVRVVLDYVVLYCLVLHITDFVREIFPIQGDIPPVKS